MARPEDRAAAEHGGVLHRALHGLRVALTITAGRLDEDLPAGSTAETPADPDPDRGDASARAR